MQITSNITGMEAGVCVSTDKDGRHHCVTVVKGTFSARKNGSVTLADEQEPLVYADIHHGDPGETSIRYECDFAPFKPFADILVNGNAYSRDDRPVEALDVSLEVGPIKKQIVVIGDRHWERGASGPVPTRPKPFVMMPLTYDRAFGGSDNSHEQEQYRGAELHNLAGVGFHINSSLEAILGAPLPNLEHPSKRISHWSSKPPPVGFGVIGRNWQPRLGYAGTYDDRWLTERYPFLPGDFDERYFQSAPVDQQMSFLQGGELVRCTNMCPRGRFDCWLPTLNLGIVFEFKAQSMMQQPNLDTLIIEPCRNRVILVWRTRATLGRKLNALLGVHVLETPPASDAAGRGIV